MPDRIDLPPEGYAWGRALVPTETPQKRDRLLKFEEETGSVKKFEYTRLKDMRHRIRLLKLRPGRQNSDAEVACELVEAQFQPKGGGVLKGVGSDETYTYEALTWCWGTQPTDCLIFIEKSDNTRTKLAVSSEVAWALKYLRKPDTCRILWIDAICIDQSSTDEKNHQVQMMSMIYTYAERVCVWLGMDDPSSRRAIAFVKDEILQLQRIDELCDDEKNAQKWQALLLLMQRPWFFRRWVVQEISLAKDAVIYCGPDQIPWNDFCVAVELFVEIETATHRLSEIIKKDPKFYHLPGWFDYVSALGASLLVQATTTIFRQYQPESLEKRRTEGARRRATFLAPSRSMSQLYDSDSDLSPSEHSDDEDSAPEDDTAPSKVSENTSPMLHRSPLLSLEYLVSKLSIFETTEPRDAIYAFLAIAKDTVPMAFARAGKYDPEDEIHSALELFERKEKKLFPVDYDRPYDEVCQTFMEFCISNSNHPGARARALDILCRPWAPSPHGGISRQKSRLVRLDPIISEAYYKRAEKFQPQAPSLDWNLPATEHKSKVPSDMDGPFTGALNEFMSKHDSRLKKMAKKREESVFPSWIPRLEGAPFVMSATPGTNIKKMARQNADPLVGLPGDERTYDASQGMGVDLKALKFNRLYLRGAHCMHVRGFILDTVERICPTSQGGQIPKKWLKRAKWDNAGDPSKDEGPPDEFWRTIVADRGVNARNPPSFYARACKESAAKGGLAGGTISTTDLIYNERNSIVVQFCRRVQEVIWNKRLIVTEKGYLGLASEKVHVGDLVCIFYGASVPVILRKRQKTKEEMEMERDEEKLFRKLRIMRSLVRNLAIKRRQAKKWKSLPDTAPKGLTIDEGRRKWGKDTVRKDLENWRRTQQMLQGFRGPIDAFSGRSQTDGMDMTIESTSSDRRTAQPRSQPSPDPLGARRVLHRGKQPVDGASLDRQTTGNGEDGMGTEETEPKISEDYYKFLGECYVHGMMDGEAMKRSESPKDPWPEEEEDPIFELR